MKIIRNAKAMQRLALKLKRDGRSVGCVPTMGALHEGHLSLVRASKKENDFTCVSVFVNPLQFGPSEDFRKYPRPAAADAALCRRAGVDFLFMPSSAELYGDDFRTSVEVRDMGDVLCGASRKGHFKGVATVVAKLFNIMQPDRAYFGRKDFQQSVIISRMAADLNFPVKIRVMPIVRAADGLALSSRNAYLGKAERAAAPALARALSKAFSTVRSGTRATAPVLAAMRRLIAAEKGVKIEYIAAVDASTLAPVKKIRGRTAFLVAARVGKTRLIDNIVVK